MAFKSVLDPNFTYRNAASTDLRKTFERVRKEMMEQRRLAERGRARIVGVIAAPPRTTDDRRFNP